MKLTMLGTGGAFTRIRSNYHNNALLEIGDGRYLIDCSLYGLDALEKHRGLSPLDVDGVLVTHMHGDHVSGLEEVGFRTFFFGDTKPGLFCHPRLLPGRCEAVEDAELDLWDHCLRAGMQKIRHPVRGPIDADLETYFEPRPVEQFRLGEGDDEVNLEWFSTRHAPGMASFGLRIETGENSVCYTADARPFDEEFYRSFDVILHDCMLTPPFEGTLHAHLDELLELPAELQKRIHIMHYGDVDEAVERTADEELNVAEPGETFEF